MVDSEGVYLILQHHNSMLQDSLREEVSFPYKNVQRVIVCGMGGSGVVGDFVQVLAPRVVVEVVKGYSLPRWVGPDDLVCCVSYSGNTEEVLSCYADARKRNSGLFVVSSGGRLLDDAIEHGVPHARIAPGLHPRFSTEIMLIPILKVLKGLGVSEAVDRIPGGVKVDEVACQQYAAELKGKIPIVYASRINMVLAEKFKTDINENAKFPAFFNVFPESNHNELNSYEHITPDFVVVFLIDPADHERIKVRMNAVKRLLGEKRVKVLEIPLSSHERAYTLLHANTMSLLVSYFLAQACGVDPGPVELIEHFKKEITKK